MSTSYKRYKEVWWNFAKMEGDHKFRIIQTVLAYDSEINTKLFVFQSMS